MGPFVLSILFVLTFVLAWQFCSKAIRFSCLCYHLKKRRSSLLTKVFLFQKSCFKIKTKKTFKISSGFSIQKICRSLKRRVMLKIYSILFKRNVSSFCWLLSRRASIFMFCDKNQSTFCIEICWEKQPFIFCLFDESSVLFIEL